MVETVLSDTAGNPLEMTEAFLQYLESRVERELFLEESVDAVRFMNVHKSKGLEGNIVIVADRSENVTAEKEENVRYRVKEDNKVEYFYYGCIRNSDNLYGRKYSGFQAGTPVWKYAVEEGAKEQTRLEYVTATRAKHVLIFMNPLREEWAFSGMDLSEQPSITHMMEQESEETQNPQEDEAGTEEVRSYEPVSEEINVSLCDRPYIGISPSDLEKGVKSKKAKGAAEQETVATTGIPELEQHPELEAEDEWEESVEEKDERPKGNVFGTVMHRCFELLMEGWQREKNLESAVESLDALIALAIMENQKDMKKRYGSAYADNVQKYQDYLKKVLTDFLKDEEMKQLFLDTEELYTEYPFSFYTSKEKDPALVDAIAKWLPELTAKQEIWVNGTADLVLRRKDGSIVIVDYKSDIKKADWTEEDFEKHLQKYDGQLMLYQYAMAKLFSVPVEKVETRLYPIARKE